MRKVYKIRDKTTGLFLNRCKKKVSPKQRFTWSNQGKIFARKDDISRFMTKYFKNLRISGYSTMIESDRLHRIYEHNRNICMFFIKANLEVVVFEIKEIRRAPLNDKIEEWKEVIANREELKNIKRDKLSWTNYKSNYSATKCYRLRDAKTQKYLSLNYKRVKYGYTKDGKLFGTRSHVTRTIKEIIHQFRFYCRDTKLLEVLRPDVELVEYKMKEVDSYKLDKTAAHLCILNAL